MSEARAVQPLTWQVGRTSHAAEPPSEFVPAEVPGAVQLDWARARGFPAYWLADHFKAYRGLEDFFWLYRTRLELPPHTPDQRVFFVCGGVDYRFQVLLEGQVLHDQEGMFSPFEIELTNRAKSGDTLEILVFPAPKAHGAPEDRSQARFSNKPPVSYGWDFHPRLIPLGIWQETGLEVREPVHLTATRFDYRLSEALDEAHISVQVETSALPAQSALTAPATLPAGVSVRLFDPDGALVLESRSARVTLPEPRLWWPAGEGAPALYTFEIELHGRIAHRQKVGFRRVRLVMHAGAWDEPAQFPKSRSQPPITLEVNGRVIFARGSNWVAPAIFPGTIGAVTYRPLLELARDAHFNLLRTWGGAISNKAAFYQLCDEFGLLVWTEFQLACNSYDGGDDYLTVLDRESRSIIRAVREHPSLAFWSGGNELFNAWSGMTDQSLALRLLNKNCYELDRDTPFIPTAPLGGMGHGDYRFRDERGREVFQIFADARHTAYSEFGCPGPASVECLKAFIPEAELFPPQPGSAWETHHGLGAWEMDPGTWLCERTIEHYFGPSRTLEELVMRGQLLQAEGYLCLFEEARRQKPVCSMALNWCLNEPWPCAANNSLLSWPAQPKPAYFAARAACRPVLASARVRKFSWRPGESFEAELWLLNDSPREVAGGIFDAELEIDGVCSALGRFEFAALSPNQNLRGPTVRRELPRSAAQIFSLRVRVVGRSELTSEYRFVYQKSAETAAAKAETRGLNV